MMAEGRILIDGFYDDVRPLTAAGAAQARERIDAAVAVGPVDAERVAPDEPNVLRHVGVGLAEERQSQLPVHAALIAAVPVPDPRRMRERKAERRKHKHALTEAV